MQPLLLSSLESKQKSVVMSSWNGGDMKLTWAKRPGWIFTLFECHLSDTLLDHTVFSPCCTHFILSIYIRPLEGKTLFFVRMEKWGNIKGTGNLLAWYPICSSWVEAVRGFIKNWLLQDGFWGKSATHETFAVKESSKHIWETSTCQDLCIISCSVI